MEARLRESPGDALAAYLMSQIRFAFGDHDSPLALAAKAVTLDGNVAKYHRQLAEVTGVMAQHAGLFQQLVLARRFKKEIDAALALDAKDIQALRDAMEFYLLAPGIAGGDKEKAPAVAEQIAVIDRSEGFRAEARLAQFRKDSGSEEALLRKAANAVPANYKASIALAQFELSKENPELETAESAARQALQIDRTRVDAYSTLAAVEASGARWEELDKLLLEADEAVPDDLTPHYRAAETMLRMGKNLAVAERNLRQYLAEEPEGYEPSEADARDKLRLAHSHNARPQ